MLDDNKKAAQVFLRVILGDDKIKVRNVRIQSFIQNIYGHSSQLDILALDSKGRYFNVEVQRSDEAHLQDAPDFTAVSLIRISCNQVSFTKSCRILT